MIKANDILLNSVLWNLREVTNLAEKIKDHCGDVDCTSWRYPLTSCSKLEIFKLLQNNKNLDNYTFILELTYDRLLYVFNLIIKYLETADFSGKLRLDKNIYRPKTLSLASVLYIIWDKIKAKTIHQGDSNLKLEEKAELIKSISCTEVSANKTSVYTQTQVSSISICSCCEMVQEFVSQLVVEMERNLDKELISALIMERQISKKFIVERTTWTAMSRWIDAIMKDFTSVFSAAKQEIIKSQKLSNILEGEKMKMKSKIEQFEERQRKLNADFQECKATRLKIEQEIYELKKEREYMSQEIKAKNAQIDEKNLSFENKISELKKMYENKFSKKRNINRKNKNERTLRWKKRVKFEITKRRATEAENNKILEKIRKYSGDLENLTTEMNRSKKYWSMQCSDLENEIKNLKRENVNLNVLLKEKEKLLHEHSLKILKAYPELNNMSRSKYKASGNPQIDMENQIESNNIRINLLQSENEKLRKILNKIAGK